MPFGTDMEQTKLRSRSSALLRYDSFESAAIRWESAGWVDLLEKTIKQKGIAAAAAGLKDVQYIVPN